MVSTRPLISKGSSLFINLLVTIRRAPITISIIVTFMFHNFYSSPARSRYLYLFSPSFNLTLWSGGTAKSTILQLIYFFIIIRSGRLVNIWESVCMSKSQRSLCVSFSRTDVWLRIYHILLFIVTVVVVLVVSIKKINFDRIFLKILFCSLYLPKTSKILILQILH